METSAPLPPPPPEQLTSPPLPPPPAELPVTAVVIKEENISQSQTFTFSSREQDQNLKTNNNRRRSAERADLKFNRYLEISASEPELLECSEQVRVWTNDRNVFYFDCSCERRKPTHDVKKIKKHLMQLHHKNSKKYLRMLQLSGGKQSI
jgi:hypothetical protein